MNPERDWNPHGAARLALSRAFPGAAASLRQSAPLPPYPEDLRLQAASIEGGDALFHLAWEIARCAAPLPVERHRAVLLLAMLVASGARDGSTRMPIGGADVEVLTERLMGLGATEADLRDVKDLLALLRRSSAATKDPADPTPASDSGIAAVFGHPGERRPLLIDGDWLSLQRLHQAEARFVESLLARARLRSAGSPSAADDARIEEALAAVLSTPPLLGGSPVQLSEEQTRAVRAAAGRPLALLTGGPGTGKTSVVVSLLRVLVRLGIHPKDIALAAPTGKAANRMQESARLYLSAIREPSPEDRQLLEQGASPRTLHRLLGYSPSSDSFRHHARHPLPEKVVIVDESSMIDLLLMERLFRAVSPDATLILLGDAEQLPSVDAGAVFRDLVESNAWPDRDPVLRLTRSFRMRQDDPDGARVLAAATAINTGADAALFSEGTSAGTSSETSSAPVESRSTAGEIRFRGVELLECSSGSSVQQAFLERWWNDWVRPRDEAGDVSDGVVIRSPDGFTADDERRIRLLLSHYDRQRVLCFTRIAPWTGADAVNDYFHHVRLLESERHGRASQEPGWSGRRRTPLPGEPVMMLRNDYVRGLFNGDQGVVIRAAEPGGAPRSMVVFPREEGLEAHPLDMLEGELSLGYAMTVHRSQGSEYRNVALLLPERESPLLTREVLYTAVTRARKSVVIVGQRSLLESGVRKRLTRFSGVADRLRNASVDRPSS